MIYEFKLPDIGEGLHEAEIIRWLIREGDVVKADQPIAEIQTDKAMVEMTTPVAGKVVALAGPEGATVKVGEPLIVVETEAAVAAEAAPTDHLAQEPASAVHIEAPRPTVVRKRAIAAPSVRKRARELGVPIDEVEGTGEGGRVTLADLERYVREREAAVAVAELRERSGAAVLPVGGTAIEQKADKAAWTSIASTELVVPEEERIPLRGLRKKIAEKMVKSAYTAPHVTGMDEVDVTKLVEIRKNLASELAKEQIKLTYLPFIIKAVTRALKQYPMFNASLDEETNEIVLKKRYHIASRRRRKRGLSSLSSATPIKNRSASSPSKSRNCQKKRTARRFALRSCKEARLRSRAPGRAGAGLRRRSSTIRKWRFSGLMRSNGARLSSAMKSSSAI